MKLIPNLARMVEAEKATIRTVPLPTAALSSMLKNIDRRAFDAQAFIDIGAPNLRLQMELEFWAKQMAADLRYFVPVDPDTDAVTRELIIETIAGIEAAQRAITLDDKFSALRAMVDRVGVAAPETLDPDSMFWADVSKEG